MYVWIGNNMYYRQRHRHYHHHIYTFQQKIQQGNKYQKSDFDFSRIIKQRKFMTRKKNKKKNIIKALNCTMTNHALHFFNVNKKVYKK